MFFSGHAFGGSIDSPWEPEPGDTATLRSGEVTIQAKIVEAKERSYRGIVIGFEDYDDFEYEGVKPDDEIEFRYEHLVGCIR